MPDTSIAVQRAYDWNVWIHPKIHRFPKPYRFSIGQSLTAASLDLLMNLVDATYQSRNVTALTAAVRAVNRARYLIRLAKDLGILPFAAYEHAAKALDEIGRMAGGWLKHAQQERP